MTKNTSHSSLLHAKRRVGTLNDDLVAKISSSLVIWCLMAQWHYVSLSMHETSIDSCAAQQT
jgi:hypothetical protein